MQLSRRRADAAHVTTQWFQRSHRNASYGRQIPLAAGPTAAACKKMQFPLKTAKVRRRRSQLSGALLHSAEGHCLPRTPWSQPPQQCKPSSASALVADFRREARSPDKCSNGACTASGWIVDRQRQTTVHAESSFDPQLSFPLHPVIAPIAFADSCITACQ